MHLIRGRIFKRDFFVKYLITGAAGFVGSHLTERLSSLGHSVIALDLGFSEEVKSIFQSLPNVQSVVGSVLDKELLFKLIQKSEYVIHLAAIASPEYYVNQPKRTIDLNLNASIAIIEMLRFTGKNFFYTSTSEIYGKNPAVPWSENDDRVLGSTDINRWCYSTSKAMIEHYLYACHQEQSLNFSGVRIFNCYGPRLKGRVVDSFLHAISTNTPIVIHGDGKQTRCFTYIDDLIDAIISLVTAKKASNKFYNIGSSVETTIDDLASIACDLVGLKKDEFVRYVPHSVAIGSSYEDIPRRVPNTELAEFELGWKPRVTLQQGMKLMYDYISKYDHLDAMPSFGEVDE